MLNDLKAEFSLAYVRAVAHAAGFFVQEPNRLMDGDGVDLTMFSRASGGAVRSPRLDLQLKATAQALDGDPFPFDLDVKNYDELRSTDLQIPRILVVVLVPDDRATWIKATEDQLVMHHCGYWKSLRNEAPTTNGSTIRVKVSRGSPFHVSQVEDMMTRVRNGGLP